MTECKCRVCVRWQRWWDALKPATPEALAAIEEIYGDLAVAETDSVYWRMKFDGTWDKQPASETKMKE